jgi:hypothetical protein
LWSGTVTLKEAGVALVRADLSSLAAFAYRRRTPALLPFPRKGRTASS